MTVSVGKSLRLLTLLVLLGSLAGCAGTDASRRAGDDAFWSGRLAVRVEGADRQSFSASFELSGAAQEGRLKLLSPLGSTVAQIDWNRSSAQIRNEDKTRHFASLEALVEESTGAPIPVRTLFDWLAGRNTQLPGWLADLSALPEGRLLASRLDPAPRIDLRVILDRDSRSRSD